ncbi:MAG: germination protein YpeB [Clostridia bacterium]|nr:germination protein YpeB [Clostridia bacterium]
MSKKEVSSGAEKAESLTRKNDTNETKKNPVKKTAKATAKKSTGKKSADKVKKVKAEKVKKDKKIKKEKHAKVVSEKKLARQKAREQKKLEAAKIRAQKKQARLEKKLEHKQKRLDRIAAFKEKAAERREKRRERRDMLKHESKEARIDRKKEERAAKLEAKVAKREARAAERQAKREHALKVKAEKRANKKERQHAPGFGGWLAAVISLGVTTLALGTMLTFGWLNMNGMQADMASTQMQSLYELNAIVDNLDTDLSKARVSNSANDQVRILSDIAIESEMAEVILERLPVDTQLTQNMTSFVNKMGDSAQSMLYAVANGKKLTESQKATIEYMYDTNLEMKRVLNELTANSSPKDMLKAMKGKDCNISASFGDLENNTIETPKEINDGPFSDSIKKVSAKNLEALEEINATEAERLAAEYFEDYDVTNVRCTGETLAAQLECYNLSLDTKDGEMMAQLSKKGGKVVMFNSYKDCNDKNFSVERCIDIAQDFLNDLGFENMKPVWTSENGTTCNLNFAYEQDGIIYYPDMIKVKVCEQRGMVTGMEGISYVLNHTERTAQKAAISESKAQSAVSSNVDIKAGRLTVIPLDDEEVLAYEFYGNYGDQTYYVYIDAKTGDEVQIFTVIGTAQGKALM